MTIKELFDALKPYSEISFPTSVYVDVEEIDDLFEVVGVEEDAGYRRADGTPTSIVLKIKSVDV